MQFSTKLNTSDPYELGTVASFSSQRLMFRTSTIHSTKVRQVVYPSNMTFGKLRNGFLRTGATKNPTSDLEERPSSMMSAQSWRKNLTLPMDEESLEKGLRDYLGISQPFKSISPASSTSSPFFQNRVQTSHSNNRAISRQSNISVKGYSSVDDKKRRKKFINNTEASVRNFTDSQMKDKYQYVTFIKAPSKDVLKLRKAKLSNYDITLVPSDTRRTIIEAIMRDYFLSLIPDNSDFLICKNSQSQIYTIIFTGRLVPACKSCSSITQFELSKDLGFQVLCSSKYCDIKVLHRNKLSDKTLGLLWPNTPRSDFEQSLHVKELEKSTISKLIQSGKFKKKDFSQVLLDSSTQSIRDSRPNTTANITRNSSGLRISKVIVRTVPNNTSPSSTLDNQRLNTAQGLMRSTSMKNGPIYAPEAKDFRGVPVLKDFDEKGLFSGKGVEEVIDEIDEEGGQTAKIKKKFKGIMKIGNFRTFAGEEIEEESVISKLDGYSIPGEKKEGQGISFKLDNSFEDIHNMVSMLNKGPKNHIY